MNESKPIKGLDVIEEAAGFLKNMRFSASRGAYREGERVSVTIDPRWNEGKETFSVIITCYAFGHRQVNWQELRVVVSPSGENSVPHMRPLDARGQLVIQDLRPGDYSLSSRLYVASVVGSSPGFVPLRVKAKAGAAQEVRVRGKAKTPFIYASNDGRVKATLRRVSEDEDVIAFETKDRTLEGAIVSFSLEQESGKVELSGEGILTEPEAGEALVIEGEDKKWEYRWTGSIILDKPCRLVFEVIPKES